MNFGARGQNRTADLLVTSEMLYQLSYSGLFREYSNIILKFGANENLHSLSVITVLRTHGSQRS